MITTPRRFAGAFATLALLLSSTSLAAQDTDRMVEVVEEKAGSGEFMGAVLVANGDGAVLERAWGSADLEWDIANTPDTRFRIGSVTKQFTAVGIMLLQERGALDLDAPISTYLEDTPEAWGAITVRNLLRHTSGIPNVTALDDFSQQKYLPTTREELTAMFRDLPLEFEAGSRFKYSNSGYVLLSTILEKVSGQDLATFYEENFFTPLGMDATQLDDSSLIMPKRADGYSPSGSGPINADFVQMDIPTGAGALVSTVGDLHLWQSALYGGEIISEASLAEFLTPTPHESIGEAKYAHGVIITDGAEGPIVWHGGGIEGFNSWLGYDLETKTTVAVLANLNGGAANELGQDLITMVQGGEVVLANERQEIELAPDMLAQYEGVYALAPTFKITIFTEDGKLMGQATGQSANQLFAESEDMFFLKVVDAQIRFNRGDDGEVTSLTLFQGGNEIPGAKE